MGWGRWPRRLGVATGSQRMRKPQNLKVFELVGKLRPRVVKGSPGVPRGACPGCGPAGRGPWPGDRAGGRAASTSRGYLLAAVRIHGVFPPGNSWSGPRSWVQSAAPSAPLKMRGRGGVRRRGPWEAPQEVRAALQVARPSCPAPSWAGGGCPSVGPCSLPGCSRVPHRPPHTRSCSLP